MNLDQLEEPETIEIENDEKKIRKGVFCGVDVTVDINDSYYKSYNFKVVGENKLEYTGATANHGGAPVRKDFRLKQEYKEAIEKTLDVEIINNSE